MQSSECVWSKRADKGHGWLFDGDDPYIHCQFCGEVRSTTNGMTIREGRQ